MLRKLWAVLKPFFVYYIVRSAAYLLLTAAVDAMAGIAAGTAVLGTDGGNVMTGIVNGASMVLGALPLLPMLRAELRERSTRKPETESRSVRLRRLAAVMALASAASAALNGLFSLSGLTRYSDAYRQIEAQQYAVPVWLGIVLYGVVSPVCEEIVFRGIIYNRLRQDQGAVSAAVASALLFGLFHGNMVQGLYAACMGLLIAFAYEKGGRFYFPCVFHGMANLTVYLAAVMLG